MESMYGAKNPGVLIGKTMYNMKPMNKTISKMDIFNNAGGTFMDGIFMDSSFII
jgi:hypothetical protein